MSGIPSVATLLTNQLLRKQRFNKGYSRRALARDLGVSSSYINSLLNGKKPLPIERIEKISELLGMDELEKSLLHRAWLNDIGFSDFLVGKINSTTEKLYNYYVASAAQLAVFDPWYNVVVLDLICCDNFQNNPDWISKKVGIKKKEAQESLNLLKKLGLIKEVDGKLQKVEKKMRFITPRSKKLVRDFNTTMVKKALQIQASKQSEKDFEERLITGVTFSTNPKQVKKAKSRLKEVMFEVAEILSQGQQTEVFQLNCQLFRLTEND